DLPVTIFRPSKWSTYGLLSRIYLQMGDYAKGDLNARLSMAIKRDLIDFNQLANESNYSFPLYGLENPEVMFTTAVDNFALYSTVRLNADTNLLASYSTNDLRRDIYFRS